MLSGYKTVIAGAAMVLAGLWGILACVIPGLADEPCAADASVEKLAIGLGLIGLRDAVRKGF